jgi:hypothetical protein
VVSYNVSGTSFATYLTDLINLNFLTATAIAIILEYILDDCKMSIEKTIKMCSNYIEKNTCIAINNYNISDL